MADQPTPPATSGTTTLIDMNAASALCSTFQAMNILTGVVVKLLQEHFSRPENLIYNGTSELGAKQLEGYIWSPDNTQTKIQIQPVWAYNPQDIQRRPALYVKRNKWETQRVAIDDGWTLNSVKAANGDVQQVKGEYHTRAVTGSHTVFCVGSTGAEAELLGAEVLDYLMSFAPSLRRDFGLHRCEVPEVEALSLIDESSEHFAVPVVLSYGFFWAWRLEAVAPWLKSLAIEVKGA